MMVIQMVTTVIFKTKAHSSGSCQNSEGEGNSTTSPMPGPTSHQALPVLMIMSTGMLNTFWEGTWSLRRTTFFPVSLSKQSLCLVWRSIPHVFACSGCSWVAHSMQEQKPCIKISEPEVVFHISRTEVANCLNGKSSTKFHVRFCACFSPGIIHFIIQVYLTDRPWPEPFILSMNSE